MDQNLKFQNATKTLLYTYLSQFSPMQFKLFYGIIVYCWANWQSFISKQNFFNLWCELNQFCHEYDKSFPDQYDDHEEIKSFCKAYPYYFVDKLPIDLIATLFTDYVNDRLDLLADIVKALHETDIKAAYSYANEVFGFDEPVDAVVAEAKDHIKSFS